MASIAALCVGVLALFATSLLVPATAALFREDWRSLEVFLLFGFGYGAFALLSALTLTPRLRRLNRPGLFRGALGMWITLILAAMPIFMVLEGQPAVSALFESVSAAVTMGVTFRPLEQISLSMGFFRSILAWQGGLLTLLLAVYVLGRSEVGGTTSRHLRVVLHGVQSGDLRIAKTFLEVFVPYLAATMVCAMVLVLARVEPVDALGVALGVLSTNGFMPVQSGASVLNNFAGEVVMVIFMIVGATSILWHRALLGRRWRQAGEQAENQTFLIAVLIVAVLSAVVATMTRPDGTNAAQAAFSSVFDVVSLMTTTGVTHDQRFGLGLPFELVLTLALVGGCAFSTSGGLKLFRMVTMFHHSWNEVLRLVYPHAVLRRSVDADVAELTRAKAVWSALFLSIVILVLSSIVFSFQGIALDKSLGLAIGSFSATGNLVASSVGGTGSLPSDSVLLTISALALVARVELLVVFAALGRSDW